MSREFWLILGAGVAVLGAYSLPLEGIAEGAGGSAAEVAAYPTRAITIVTWVSPGSPTDLLARTIAGIGQKYFGQRITVINKQGGGGAVAMGYLLRQRPDGHTLAISTASGTVNMAAGHLPFEPGQFTYISRVQLDPYLVAVRSDSQFETLNDFFEYAHMHPGELSVSGFGTASGHFLSFARLKDQAGDPEVRWVAYEGSADAAMAALGGHTDAVHTNYNVIREHLRAGGVRILGISEAVSSVPDVPTYAQQGYPISPVHWRGVKGPGRMAPELVARIHRLLQQTFRDPEFLRFMETSGTEFGDFGAPAQFQAFVEAERADAHAVLTTLGLAR